MPLILDLKTAVNKSNTPATVCTVCYFSVREKKDVLR